MKFCSIWISCFMVAAILLSSVQSGSIDPSVRIGDFTKIGENVTIKANSVIGSFAKVDSHTVIKENSIVGDYAHIFMRCLLGKNVQLNNFVKVGMQTTIADYVLVKELAQIGEKTSIASLVTIDQYAKVGNNNQIEKGSTLAQHSSTGANAKIDVKAIMDRHAQFHGEYIGKRGYLGQFCIIGPKVNIGESAVVHENVVLKPGTKIQPTEIVIRTPTSTIFYEKAAKDVTDDEAKIAKPSGQSISPLFNKFLRELIEKDLQTLRTSCSKSSNNKSRPKSLPKMISLYLIQYHGLEREYMEGLRGNGRLPDAEKKMFQKECHLGEQAGKTILESDVNEKFIQLLTIDQDATRQYRVHGDQFCEMLDQILNKQRNIRFDDAECNKKNN